MATGLQRVIDDDALTLAKQMRPGQTALFMKQYEDAVQRPFGCLFFDLKPTTHDSWRL